MKLALFVGAILLILVVRGAFSFGVAIIVFIILCLIFNKSSNK